MKKALFVLLFALAMSAGAAPFAAFGQTPPVAPPATSAPQVTAQDAYTVAASTLAEMRRSVEELRRAVRKARAKGASDANAVKALETRLTETEHGYAALKAAVEELKAGGDPAKLSKAHADALLLLKGSKEALAAYERLHIGVAGDLSGTAAGFKCPSGTMPSKKVSSVVLIGRGNSNDVAFECVALTGDVVVPEKRSETAAAMGMADATRIKAAVDARREQCERERAESPPVWKQAVGFGLGALGLVVGSYFGAGALSSASNAHHNGLVAAGAVGGAVAATLGLVAATSGGCHSLR